MRPETVNPIDLHRQRQRSALPEPSRIASPDSTCWPARTGRRRRASAGIAARSTGLNDFWLALDPRVDRRVRADRSVAPHPDVHAGRRVRHADLGGARACAADPGAPSRSSAASPPRTPSRPGSAGAARAAARPNPQNPNFSFQTINDLLTNTPNSMNLQSGQPPHDAHLDNFGGFLQDDWRVNSAAGAEPGRPLRLLPGVPGRRPPAAGRPRS